VKIPKELIWIVTLFYVQQLPAVSASGVDLPLVFVALVGLRNDIPRAAGWGFLMGLFQDLLSSGWVGPNTIAKTLTAVLASLLKMHIYRERVLTQTFLVFLSVLFHQIFVWLLLKWDGTAPLAGDALGILLRSLLGTTLAGAIVCIFVVRFRKRRFDPATA
jgi:rod shape-determining protein MreD